MTAVVVAHVTEVEFVVKCVPSRRLTRFCARDGIFTSVGGAIIA